MKIIVLLSAMYVAFSASAHPGGPGVTKAKAIELTAHRIDRLVTLGKIDASFMTKLEKIEIAVVENQAPVFYRVRASQTQPTQGLPMQLDVSFDDDGKPLAFQVVAGGVAGPEVGWSEKDAVSLTENALHYILENNTDAKIALFDKGIRSFVLSKDQLNGATVARGQATSTLTTEKLNVYLKLDGTFISVEIEP